MFQICPFWTVIVQLEKNSLGSFKKLLCKWYLSHSNISFHYLCWRSSKSILFAEVFKINCWIVKGHYKWILLWEPSALHFQSTIWMAFADELAWLTGCITTTFESLSEMKSNLSIIALQHSKQEQWLAFILDNQSNMVQCIELRQR